LNPRFVAFKAGLKAAELFRKVNFAFGWLGLISSKADLYSVFAQLARLQARREFRNDTLFVPLFLSSVNIASA
jgi:hypothetical protein